jgi:carboxypeptidase Taq
VGRKKINISVDQQRKVFRAILSDLGFDFTKGDFYETSVAAVEGGVPDNVRLLVSGCEDHPTLSAFATKLRLIMHEAAGHGIALQNTPVAFRHTPLGGFFGMPYHEAIALLHDRVLMNRPSFLNYVAHKAYEICGETGLNGSELFQERRSIKNSFLRRQADEISFHFHAAIRHYLEKPLVNETLDEIDRERFSRVLGSEDPILSSGHFELSDFPRVWNQFYHHYFGQAPSEPSQGFLQDVQIFVGKWSYHAAYPMGHQIAVGLWQDMTNEHPDMDAQIEHGDFTSFNGWMRQNVYSQPTFQNIDNLKGAQTNVEALILHQSQQAGRILQNQSSCQPQFS